MPRTSTVSRQWSSMYRARVCGVGTRGWMSQSIAPWYGPFALIRAQSWTVNKEQQRSACCLASRCRPSAGLADDVARDRAWAHAFLASGPTACRHASMVHRLGIAGYEGMPPFKIAALCQAPVGARLRQPPYLAQGVRADDDAVGHLRMARRVLAAAARAQVEKATSELGQEDLAAILVFHLEQATLATAVAERFPLSTRHRLQRRGLPERRCFDCSR